MPSENKTANIGLNQWQANEYPKREDFNADNLAIDEALDEKLGKSGEGKDVTVSFDEATTRTNIGTGQKLSVLFGKIKKWFSDLTDLAFGKCGSTANQALYTTEGGVVTADKLPIEAGGTGARTAEEARTNLAISDATVPISDDVAAALGLNPANNPQVKDGFSKLSNATFISNHILTNINGDYFDSIRVGEIKPSIRKDMLTDNRYILCDGRTLNVENYLELAEDADFWYFRSSNAPVSTVYHNNDARDIYNYNNKKLVFIGDNSYYLDLADNTWHTLSAVFTNYGAAPQQKCVFVNDHCIKLNDRRIFKNTGLEDNFELKLSTSGQTAYRNQQLYTSLNNRTVYAQIQVDHSIFEWYRSNDGGETWNKISPSLGNRQPALILDESRMIFNWSYSGDNTYYTDDYGVTKHPIPDLENISMRSNGVKIRNTIFIGTNKGIYKSENNGLNWTQIYAEGTTMDIRHISVSPNKKTIMFTSAEGYFHPVRISDNYGSTFRRVDAFDSFSVCRIHDRYIYVASEDKIKISHKTLTIPDIPNHYLKVSK